MYEEANAKLVLLTDEVTDLLNGINSIDKRSIQKLSEDYSQTSGNYSIEKTYMPGTLVFDGTDYYRCLLKNKNVILTVTEVWKKL